MGHGQIALSKGFYFVTGVYVHAVSPENVRTAVGDLWVWGDEWYPTMEEVLKDPKHD